jgi:cytochrome b pre-mRNA-processing protein 3
MISSLVQRFKGLFREGPHAPAAQNLYMRIVEQSRLPAFFRHCAVPDTLDGRFDLIALHTFLVLHRLRGIGAEKEGAVDGRAAAKDLSQELFNAMFADMDRGLRDLGSSDVRTPKRVKVMVEAFYGRAKAYEIGLTDPGNGLAEALQRNLFRAVEGGEAPSGLMADYVRREAQNMSRQGLPDFIAGRLNFGPPPEAPGA